MKSNSSLILREIYGKAILMPIRYNEASNHPIYLNESAALIWKMASEVENREELYEKISEIYGLNEESAEGYSIKLFISSMIDQKLILE